MTVDIRTLVVVLGLTQVVQILALSLQASTKKRYGGVGWWLLWSASAAAGFAVMLLRTLPASARVAIVIQNALVVLASIFLYIGILRFLERRENRGALAAGYLAYVSALAYFVYARDDIVVRSVLTSLALAGMAGLSALSLVTGKRPAGRGAAYFCSAVFLGHMLVCLHRAAAILAGADVTDLFGPTLFNAFVYLDGILASLLWTFGLIIMVNQRASAEMAEGNLRLTLAVESARIGVHEWDIVSNQLTWDDRVCELWGVAPGTAVSSELFMRGVRWDDRSRVQAALDRLFAPGETAGIGTNTVSSASRTGWSAGSSCTARCSTTLDVRYVSSERPWTSARERRRRRRPRRPTPVGPGWPRRMPSG